MRAFYESLRHSRALPPHTFPQIEASLGQSGQTMLQVTIRPVPPTKHSPSLGSAPARFWVPRSRDGGRRRYVT